MIKLYFANPGAGKTTFLARTAQKYTRPTRLSTVLNKITFGKIKKKKKYDNVYCNVPIWGTLMYDVNQDMGQKHIENSLILIDEGAIELDNRVPLKKYQKTFLRLHRHYKCDIICTSQSWEDINIVVRRLYDKIYLMNRTLFKHTTLIREISKSIDIDDDGNIKDSYHFKLLGIRLFHRKKWYRFFNSYDKPELKPKEQTKEYDFRDIPYNGILPPTKREKLLVAVKRIPKTVKNMYKNFRKPKKPKSRTINPKKLLEKDKNKKVS